MTDSQRFRRRAVVAWAFMAVGMTANGIIRENALKAWLGAEGAEVASAASGIAIIQIIGRWGVRGDRADSRRQLVEVAALWLALTLTFEFTFGLWGDRKSWSELIENYNPAEGHLWPVVLATLVCAPFIWGRVRDGYLYSTTARLV